MGGPAAHRQNSACHHKRSRSCDVATQMEANIGDPTKQSHERSRCTFLSALKSSRARSGVRPPQSLGAAANAVQRAHQHLVQHLFEAGKRLDIAKAWEIGRRHSVEEPPEAARAGSSGGASERDLWQPCHAESDERAAPDNAQQGAHAAADALSAPSGASGCRVIFWSVLHMCAR